MMNVKTLMPVVDRITTGTSREAVPRRIKQVGGTTGEAVTHPFCFMMSLHHFKCDYEVSVPSPGFVIWKIYF